MNRRFWAFTLAETLIVMGIIGVVAALTVPNLNASTGEKEKVAKVKKIYKDLDDALGRAIAVYGPLDEWFTKDTTEEAKTTRFAERMLDFLKVSKNCKIDVGCFSTQPKYNGDGILYKSNYASELKSDGLYMIITADGTSLAFYSAVSSKCYDFRVDIDGPNKGKNQDGYDIFHFRFEEGHLFPDSFKSFSGNEVLGYDMTAWVIQNGNMDYLKLDSSGKCPDGKTILNWETNTTCK